VIPYQYVRAARRQRIGSPVQRPRDANRAAGRLDLARTEPRVSELCGLTAKGILWRPRQLRIKGKGGPHGEKTKVRVVPMSNRVRALLEHHFTLEKSFPVKTRVPRTSSRRWPTTRGSPRT
jgi:integrase